MKKTLISVVGPTAIGKTSLAIALANHFDTDIISADSRQFFMEMQIGTAVPSESEKKSAIHHFIQHKSVRDDYSVGDFEKEAVQLLEKLFYQKDTVILVGGSGLYIDAITKGLDNFPKIDPHIRVTLNQELQENGLKSLQDKLKQLDPTYYRKVDLENPHRIIRALEVCIGSGHPYSSFIGQPKPSRPFDVITIALKADREIIYNRINQRVDMMMQNGLLDEVKRVQKFKKLNALRTVGYKELFKYIDGEWDLDFAVSEIKKNTRRFAKRQLTWFKKNEDTIWVNYDSGFLEIVEMIENKKDAKINAPVFIVMGVSGCGKSTIGKLLAAELEIPFFDGDDYHPESNVKKMAAGNPLNDDDRTDWLKLLNRLSIENSNSGVVIACSALKESYRLILSKNLDDQMTFVYLNGTFEEISNRLMQRKNHFMPSGLLRSQFNTLEVPSEAIVVSILDTPKEIIAHIMECYKQKKP